MLVKVQRKNVGSSPTGTSVGQSPTGNCCIDIEPLLALILISLIFLRQREYPT